MATIYNFPNDRTDRFRKEREWKFEFESQSPIKKSWCTIRAYAEALAGITKTVIFNK
jgi:hypothetical protein